MNANITFDEYKAEATHCSTSMSLNWKVQKAKWCKIGQFNDKQKMNSETKELMSLGLKLHEGGSPKELEMIAHQYHWHTDSV